VCRSRSPAQRATSTACSFAERDHADVRSWNVYEDKSHYLHYAAPDKLAADIAEFFGNLD